MKNILFLWAVMFFALPMMSKSDNTIKCEKGDGWMLFKTSERNVKVHIKTNDILRIEMNAGGEF